MKIYEKEFHLLNHFSVTDRAYTAQDTRLFPFFKYTPEISNFAEVIKDKVLQGVDRNLLVKVLRHQYGQYTTDTSIAGKQIDSLLSENTFTIVTAHQPVLFTGPVYVIYKIISTIKLAATLKNHLPHYNFIPVFVMGGEDHDFEEMNHLHLFGKKIVWKTEQRGSVGRMNLSAMDLALNELKSILGTASGASEIFQLIFSTHTSHDRYGIAFCDLINGLFGPLGVVVLDMDNASLKQKMIDLFRHELLHTHSSDYVRHTQENLARAGFTPQAFVRDLNLFYLDDGIRNRIEKENGSYKIVDTQKIFGESEILKLVEEEPHKFSPNVIVRPLYQERILPNLAYVGGGGELAYWLERKQQFEFFGINFPMLVRRDSFQWIDASTLKKMKRLGLNPEDFLHDEKSQIDEFIRTHAEHTLTLEAEKKSLEKIWTDIEEKAGLIDPTLRGTVGAEGKNQLKALEKIEERIRKSEKQKHETSLSQIKNIREKFYPGGGLQERYVNFLEFYIRHYPDYFSILSKYADPLNMKFKILSEEIVE